MFGDDDRYHYDRACPSAGQGNLLRQGGLRACQAGAAHRSCLRPCQECASDIAQILRIVIGPVTSGEKARLPLPPLRWVRPSSEQDRGPASGHEDYVGPYGAPSTPDDPRFVSRSGTGWGTGAFGQHPDEFLGESTDDDHDWRGGDRYME